MITEFFDKIECKGKQDVAFLSYIRIYATFIVILNHVLINCIKDFPGMPAPAQDVVYFHHYITYAMFMMTGYTFMKMKRHITIRMSLIMILKYYISMMIFAIPFCFMESLYNARYVFNTNMIFEAVVNALYGRTWDHLWYIYMLLIVYLLLPMLSRIYKSDNNLLLPFFTLILFLTWVFKVDIRVNTSIYMFAWLPLNYILFSVTFGAFAYRYKIVEKVNKWVLLAVLIVYMILWFKLHMVNNYVFTVILSMILFLTFEKVFVWRNKIINYLSTYTFIIYILHVFFLHILTKILKINPFSYCGYVGAIVFTLILYVVTLLASMIIKRIPFVKELYM